MKIANEPIQVGGQSNILAGEFNNGSGFSYNVPADKRLVIEFASVRAFYRNGISNTAETMDAALNLTVNANTIRIPVVGASANRWEEPNVPTNTIDDDPGTRWSCENDGGPDCHIVFDLGSVQSVTRVAIAFFKGDERVALFGLEASLNGTDWTQVWPNGTSSSGTTSQPEPFSVGMQAQYLRYTGQGNSANNWVSVNEFHVYGKPVSSPPVLFNLGRFSGVAGTTGIPNQVLSKSLKLYADPGSTVGFYVYRSEGREEVLLNQAISGYLEAVR